jgi:hypothetical protein
MTHAWFLMSSHLHLTLSSKRGAVAKYFEGFEKTHQ